MIRPGGPVDRLDRRDIRGRAAERFEPAGWSPTTSACTRGGWPAARDAALAYGGMTRHRAPSSRDRAPASRPRRSPWPRPSDTAPSTAPSRTPAEHMLVLKHDRLFPLVTTHGDIAPAGACSLGLFQRRHPDPEPLRTLGRRAARPPCCRPRCPAPTRPRSISRSKDLDLRRRPLGPEECGPHSRELLLSDRLPERMTLTSYLGEPLEYWVELALGCDFADIFEVRGWRRAARGQYFAPGGRGRPAGVRLPGPGRPAARKRVRFRRRARSPHRRTRPMEVRARARRAASSSNGRCARTDGADRGDRRSPGRSTSGGRPLEQRLPAWREGGQPLDDRSCELRRRAAPRDGRPPRPLRRGGRRRGDLGRHPVVLDRVRPRLDHHLARRRCRSIPASRCDTLRYLARRQGEREDAVHRGAAGQDPPRAPPRRDGAAPARSRTCPTTARVDATPLWLILLHETWRWTGDDALVRELLPHAERALDWIDRYGDQDGDGFVEYARTSTKGLVNQGWKDSGDGVPFPDGRLPEPPIALVEVQGYVYDAKLRMAELFRHAGPARARRRRCAARRPRCGTRIREAFWMEELGTFALALDGAKRPVSHRHPTPATCCGAGCRRRARRALGRARGCSGPSCSRAGAFAP